MLQHFTYTLSRSNKYLSLILLDHNSHLTQYFFVETKLLFTEQVISILCRLQRNLHYENTVTQETDSGEYSLLRRPDL